MQYSPIKTARTALRHKLVSAARSIGQRAMRAQALHNRQISPPALHQQSRDHIGNTSAIEAPVPPRNVVPQKTPGPSLSDQGVTGTDKPKISFLRLKELQARIGLGRSAIYYLMDTNSPHHDKHFPRSVKISAHAVGWVESEIDAWLEFRIKAGRH